MINFFLAVPAIIWLLASGLLNACGEFLSKHWGEHPTGWLAMAVGATYALSSLIWLPALLHKNQLSTTGVAWVLIALMFTMFLSFFVFHEELGTQQWIGLALALIAVGLLIF